MFPFIRKPQQQKSFFNGIKTNTMDTAITGIVDYNANYSFHGLKLQLRWIIRTIFLVKIQCEFYLQNHPHWFGSYYRTARKTYQKLRLQLI